MKRTLMMFVLILVGLFQCCAYAEDGAGCKDHPLFSRLPGFVIFGCSEKDVDTLDVPRFGRKAWTRPEDYLSVEGKIVAVHYKPKEGATAPNAAQIIKTFQDAVEQGGGTLRGEYDAHLFAPFAPSVVRYLGGSSVGSAFDRYAVMNIPLNGSEFWIFVTASEGSRAYSILTLQKAEAQKTLGLEDVLEKLNTDGFVTYRMNFAPGGAVLKTDSQPSIDQIIAVMKENPDLKISIEGHTDNAYSPAESKILSEKRARAVLNAVFASGISAERLSAIGYGQERPLADNRDEQGRALNQRIEIVKK